MRQQYKRVDLRAIERGYLPDGRYSVYYGGSYLGNVRVERVDGSVHTYGCK